MRLFVDSRPSKARGEVVIILWGIGRDLVLRSLSDERCPK
jgi:hypothetical protein